MTSYRDCGSCSPERRRGRGMTITGALSWETMAERAYLDGRAAARADALEEAARVSCCDVCADEFRARAATPPPTKE